MDEGAKASSSDAELMQMESLPDLLKVVPGKADGKATTSSKSLDSVESGDISISADRAPPLLFFVDHDRVSVIIGRALLVLHIMGVLLLGIVLLLVTLADVDVLDLSQDFATQQQAERRVQTLFYLSVALFLLMGTWGLYEIISGIHSKNSKHYMHLLIIKLAGLVVSPLMLFEPLADAQWGYVALPFLYLIEVILIVSVLVRSTKHQGALVVKKEEHLARTVLGSASGSIPPMGRQQSDAERKITGVGGRLFMLARRVVTSSALDRGTLESELKQTALRQSIEKALERNFFARITTLVLLAILVTFVIEFLKVVTTQNPMFGLGDVQMMSAARENDTTNMALARGQRLFSSNKVVVVVMDGLREDHMDKLVFWNDAAYVGACDASTSRNATGHGCVLDRDVRGFRMRNQLPSMSVPNWMTLLTGAPPEITGVIGNLLVSDTSLESIYSVAQDAKVQRFVTGTPWFAAIIKSRLDFFCSDGTVSAAYKAGEYTLPTAAPADRKRLETVLQAIDATDPAFQLMLAHFSDIDNQGHCCGVTAAHNKKDSYNQAIKEKAAHLAEIMSRVDDDTIVIITADHGHVDAGGHGGIGDDLRNIPFYVYKRNSGARDGIPDTNQESLTNMDVAPTVAALMGLTVPGQAFGHFVRDVVTFPPFVPDNAGQQLRHYQDLAAQKVTLYEHTAGVLNLGNLWTEKAPATCTSLGTCTPCTSIAECHTLVDELRTAWLEVRDQAHIDQLVFHFSLGFIFLIAIFLFSGLTLHYFTLAHVGALVGCAMSSNQARYNRLACLRALGVILTYYLLVIAIYLLTYLFFDYTEWDSTVVHTPAVIARFMAATFLPGIVVAYLLIRMVKFSMIEREGLTFRLKVLRFLRDKGCTYKDAPGIYLFQIYLNFFVLVANTVVYYICFGFTFVMPLSFAVPWITEYNWPYRFRSITTLGMGVPLMISSIVMTWSWKWRYVSDNGYMKFRRLAHWHVIHED